MLKSSEIDVAWIDVLPGNIIQVTAKSGVVINLDTAKRITSSVSELIDHSIETSAALFEISGIVYMEEDAREYFANDIDEFGITVGLALVSVTYLGKFVGNQFTTLHPKTKFPIKYFDSPMRAEHWIRTLIKNYNEDLDRRVA